MKDVKSVSVVNWYMNKDLYLKTISVTPSKRLPPTVANIGSI